MLMPKKTKYRKIRKGKVRGISKARKIVFGDYALIAVESGWLTARQIESARVTMGRRLKKVGELFLRVFPDKPVTKKPAETRMGKGKGNPEFWVCVVKRGKVLFEVKDLDKQTAKNVLCSASYKIPMKTRFITKKEQIDSEITL
ncbi:50S ribosomal protein L16 [Candidatus Babeliales bacterium]|nr:50S ribosomal protein L16 [Candidatus Babeliales bacterium]